MTLLAMLDFFEVNEVSPNERLGETISSLKYQMKKRFNAVVAIIRDIEKNQTKPTNAMLQALLEGNIETEKEEEIFDFGEPTIISEDEELTYYRTEYFNYQEKYNTLNHQMKKVLGNVKFIKGNFSSGYFKLDISKEEFETLKQELDNVYHHNRTKIRR